MIVFRVGSRDVAFRIGLNYVKVKFERRTFVMSPSRGHYTVYAPYICLCLTLCQKCHSKTQFRLLDPIICNTAVKRRMVCSHRNSKKGATSFIKTHSHFAYHSLTLLFYKNNKYNLLAIKTSKIYLYRDTRKKVLFNKIIY